MKKILAACFCLTSCFLGAQTPDSARASKQIDSLLRLSGETLRKRQFPEALAFADSAMNIAGQQLGTTAPAYTDCLFQQARVHHNQGNMKKAEALYREVKARRAVNPGIQSLKYAESIQYLGVLFYHTSRYDSAEHHYRETLRLRASLSGREHPDYARSLANLATLFDVTGRPGAADTLYQEALAVFAHNPGRESVEYSACLHNRGICSHLLGRYDAAEKQFLEALAIREKVYGGREHILVAQTLGTLGNLYADMGRYEDAEPLQIETKSIREKLGKSSRDFAKSLTSLAITYRRMGRYEASERYYREALDVYEQSPGVERNQYAAALEGLAVLYETTERYARADTLYQKILDIRQSLYGRDNSPYAITLQNLGSLYYTMGKYREAEERLKEAIAIEEKTRGIEHPDYARMLHNLALVYRATRRDSLAEMYLLGANTIRERALGKENAGYVAGTRELARLYRETGRPDQAGDLLTTSAHIQQSLLIRSAKHLSERDMQAYTGLFANDLHTFFSFAHSRHTLDAGLPGECFDQALFYKGFLLTSAQRLHRLATTDSVATRQFERLQACHRRLAQVYSLPVAERKAGELYELEEQANHAEKELAFRVAGFADAVRQVRWQEVRAALKPGEAAIEFIHFRLYTPDATDSILYAALVLRADDAPDAGPRFISLFEERQLTRLMPESDDADRIERFYRDSSQAAFGLVWRPLEPLLNGIVKVYCAPSGWLHYLHLGALPADTNQTFDDRHSLALLGSTRQLASVTPGQYANRRAVLFGAIRYDADPAPASSAKPAPVRKPPLQPMPPGAVPDPAVTRGGIPWKYLEGSEKGMKDLASRLRQNGFQPETYTGSAATEEAFKNLPQPGPRLLLFATHGYFYADPVFTQPLREGTGGGGPVFKTSEHPMIRSGLILAGANQAWTTGKPPAGRDDGILTAYEISRQNLAATELVVLSACETGLGDIAGYEGVYGLQRAFKIAGTKYLVMSLWEVGNKVAGEWTDVLFQEYAARRKPVPEAFRAARAEMRKRYPGSPWAWAAFVLVE